MEVQLTNSQPYELRLEKNGPNCKASVEIDFERVNCDRRNPGGGGTPI